MNAYYKGQLIFGERGPAGPDGSPIGTVISYMGLTAPKDYLICDGAEYPVSDYPGLAAFFAEQFGSSNHFGGDGSTTFAVPDMRNLFLRGYHGEMEERLSGSVGKRQEATQMPNIMTNGTDKTIGHYTKEGHVAVAYPDSEIGTFDHVRYTSVNSLSDTLGVNVPSTFTSRPVNMAVLYCIKAVESVPAKDVYSTEETKVGTWIDGKPLYRKVVSVTAPNTLNSWIDTTAAFPNVSAFFVSTFYIGSKYTDFGAIGFRVENGKLQVILRAAYTNQRIAAICMYTKTTD